MILYFQYYAYLLPPADARSLDNPQQTSGGMPGGAVYGKYDFFEYMHLFTACFSV